MVATTRLGGVAFVAALALGRLDASADEALVEAPTRTADRTASSLAKDIGPRERPARPGAVVARTSAELAGLLADANGPSEIELEATTYHGDFDVRRPVAIRGQRGTVIEGTGSDSVVSIDAKDVVFENVTVRHSGRRHTHEDAGIRATGERVRVADVRVEETLFGVALAACHHCQVERAHVIGFGDDAELRGDGIKLWEADDSSVRDSLAEHTRDIVVWYTRRAVLENNVVERSRYGSHFMYAHDAVVRRSTFRDNVVGIFVMYSMRLEVEGNVMAGSRGPAGVGLGLKDSDAVTVRGNWIVANTTGTYLDNTPRTPADPVVFEANRFALDNVAVRIHGPEDGLSFRGNDFHQNPTLIENDARGDALKVDARGNHYTDYEGYDLDGDGVGDVAYEVKALSSELTESRPAIGFFRGTAAMALVDTVARAAPVLAKHLLFVDPAPLMRAPELVAP